jgi:polysaccharide export outer membrane protein
MMRRSRIGFAALVICLGMIGLRGLARAQDDAAQPVQPVQPGQDQPSQPDDTGQQPVVAGDASPGEADAPPAGASGVLPSGIRLGPNYVVGPEDLLTIDVFEVPELSKLTVQVANDGTIALPLLGRVRAAGLTTEQLRQELADEWGKNYLQNPQITLLVKQAKAHPVTVLGAVEKAGVYQLTGRRTLLEVLAMAGGLAKRGTGAAGRLVFVERPGGFKDLHPVDGMNLMADNPDKVAIDLHKLLYSQDTALNIDIHPFDIITVSKAGLVYVVGAVQKPGAFLLEDKDTVTVLEALAMAQGFAGDAWKSHVRVIHRADNGALSETPVDLGKIMKGKSNDMALAANDVLLVPNSTGKAVGKRSIESTVGVVSGLLIWGRL